MIWTPDQMSDFERDPDIGPENVEIDRMMRFMAGSLCRIALNNFDAEWNINPPPLGPNWSTFASELETLVKQAHIDDDATSLSSYYSFLNWAAYEPTTALPGLVVVSPIEGLIEVKHSKWLKYFPPQFLRKIYKQLRPFFNVSGMKEEIDLLLSNTEEHSKFWRPCHEKFTEVAVSKNIPYSIEL